MPKPKVVPNKPPAERTTPRGAARSRMRGATLASRRATVMRPQPVYEILEPMVDDFVEEYVPIGQQVRRVRAPVLYRRPIEERVTLPPPPQVVYVPVPVRNNRRAGAKGMRGRGVQRSPGQRNNVRGVLNNTNFKTRFGAGAGRGGRAGLGRGGARRAPQGHYTPLPKKTVSQLDRELEEYMRKSKHPKIVV
ncbi:hypothetical protein Y032_0180g812 [Ancylostoma ceylanicum]|uniref:Chromatin target of PRMT1 protein C-terminal domain-containing protein n=1 Tax=Ancylostoma ceylanicum TaxID=53326 RepID=A0A016STC4_9BILA|nr:hypothetical protein Y032_0180g812 [Ancylostoma ceylanicum]